MSNKGTFPQTSFYHFSVVTVYLEISNSLEDSD